MTTVRTFLPIVLFVALTSLAHGEPVHLWTLEVLDYRHLNGSSSFRMSTRSDAFIEFSGCCSMAGGAVPEHDAPTAEFARDLTNGVNNPITVSSPYFSFTFDENFLLSTNEDEERHIANSTSLSPTSTNGIDLQGWRITGFGMGISTTTNDIWSYGVTAWAVPVPEPPCVTFLFEVFLLFSVRGSRTRSRRSRRSCVV